MDDDEKNKDYEEAEMSQEECVKCAEYKDGWKRALADYQNLQKDLARERINMRASAHEEIVSKLITAIDHFEQALSHILEENAFTKGIRLIKQEIESVLASVGAVQYGEVGESYDPHLHESVEERSDQEKKDNEILEVKRSGWKLNGKVLRPAQVVVKSDV
ncbi:MAG: hypothetical protein ACD_76C00047G0003 [uncultured bacterium]|nr:MAG: hypothetical protein ACD_76C00047G0003 [uncultured bacterium]HBD05248.1 nucleotide exchange factor GrpE [Candidatus Uhrbacteria bacterium]